MRNRKFISTISILGLLLLFWILYLPINSKSEICQSDIKMPKKFKKYLANNNQLEVLCDYQNEVLILNRLNYLDSIYEVSVVKNDKFILEGADYYSNVIIRIDENKFIPYYKSLGKDKQFKIWSYIKVNKNKSKSSLFLLIDKVYKEKR